MIKGARWVIGATWWVCEWCLHNTNGSTREPFHPPSPNLFLSRPPLLLHTYYNTPAKKSKQIKNHLQKGAVLVVDKKPFHAIGPLCQRGEGREEVAVAEQALVDVARVNRPVQARFAAVVVGKTNKRVVRVGGVRR